MRKLGRRGTLSVEYMLLVCMLTSVTLATGVFLKAYGAELVQKVLDKILAAAIELASP